MKSMREDDIPVSGTWIIPPRGPRRTAARPTTPDHRQANVRQTRPFHACHCHYHGQDAHAIRRSHHLPRSEDQMCPITLLHDCLVLLATADSPLVVQAAACFELVWHVNTTGREALVAQTLPHLVALALTFGASSRLVLYPPPSCSMMRYSCSATTMTRASLTLRCS